jgi:hypothetical protein
MLGENICWEKGVGSGIVFLIGKRKRGVIKTNGQKGGEGGGRFREKPHCRTPT